MFLDRRYQKFRIAGTLSEHPILRDDLILGLLYLHELSEFRGLAQLSFPNDFRVRLEHTDQLPRETSDPLENTRAGLLHYLSYSIGHHRQSLRQRLQPPAVRTR